MSVKVMGIVWDADLPRAEKFVLLAYADHADHDGGNVYPSYGLVAYKTGYTKRQVIRIVEELEAKQIMVREGVSQLDTMLWRIDISKIPLLPARKTNKNIAGGVKKSPGDVNFTPPAMQESTLPGENSAPGGDIFTPGSDIFTLGGDISDKKTLKMSPEPSFNRQLNHPLKPSEREGEAPLALSPGVQKLAAITGQQYDPALQALIAQTLGETPDLERLQAAALAWKAHGYKPRNLDGILEWYRQGIPGRSGALGEPLRDAAYYGLAEAGSSGPEEPEELEAGELEMPRPQPVPPPPDPALDKAFPGYSDRPSGMTPRRAWQAARNQLQMEIPKAVFETWVRHANLLSFDPSAGVYVIGAPNEYAKDWLQSRLASTVTRLLTGMSNRTIEVQFVVQELQPA